MDLLGELESDGRERLARRQRSRAPKGDFSRMEAHDVGVAQPDSPHDRPPRRRGNGRFATDGPRQWIAGARRRLEGSWVQDFVARLSAVDFGNAIVLFGASLLLCALPLLILLSSA